MTNRPRQVLCNRQQQSIVPVEAIREYLERRERPRGGGMMEGRPEDKVLGDATRSNRATIAAADAIVQKAIDESRERAWVNDPVVPERGMRHGDEEWTSVFTQRPNDWALCQVKISDAACCDALYIWTPGGGGWWTPDGQPVAGVTQWRPWYPHPMVLGERTS